jgi:phosphoribosyl 1,2-cyclic phosphodiesterase
MQVTFWGVRGSTPTPGASTVGHGGNSSCVQLSLHDGSEVVIDAGTGLRVLGLSLLRRGEPVSMHLLLSHFHWDHIQGLPFFAPLYLPTTELFIHSGRPPEECRRLLEGQMSPPYFPVEYKTLPSRICYSQCDLPGMRCFPMNHPQGSFGYRVEADGVAVVYACDFEHGEPRSDETLRENARGADILIYDAQYTPEEYEARRGWGHSTWLEATRAARDAGVKKLILTHHDPSHSDEALAGILAQARREFPNTEMAREGWSFELTAESSGPQRG